MMKCCGLVVALLITLHLVLSQAAGKRSFDRKTFNFASADVGAKILATNPEAKKASRLLNEDRDNYMLNPRTAEKKWVTLELSEEILMQTFSIANFEYYSCSPHFFQVLGSREYPCRAPKCYWEILGTFEAHNTRTIQTFMLQKPALTRFLKFMLLTHYGDQEYFCTLSLIRVHGSTLLEDLKASLYDNKKISSFDTSIQDREQLVPKITDYDLTQDISDLRSVSSIDMEINVKTLDEKPLIDTGAIRSTFDNAKTKHHLKLKPPKTCMRSPAQQVSFKPHSQYDSETENMGTCKRITFSNSMIVIPSPTAVAPATNIAIRYCPVARYPKNVFRRNFSLVNMSQLATSKTEKMTDHTHRNVFDAIQPTHVESPQKQTKSVKKLLVDAVLPEEDEEQAIPVRQSRDETSENILKSLYMRIRKQEEAHEALTRKLKAVHSKYVDAFRDIESVLNKTAHEHNMLASAVQLMGKELRKEIVADLRSGIKGEMDELKLMNQYKIDLLFHEYNQSIYTIIDQRISRVQMIIMTATVGQLIVTVVVALYMCFPSPQEPSEAPTPTPRVSPQNFVSPQPQRYDSPSRRHNIRLVDHIVNYLTDSDGPSRPTTPTPSRQYVSSDIFATSKDPAETTDTAKEISSSMSRTLTFNTSPIPAHRKTGRMFKRSKSLTTDDLVNLDPPKHSTRKRPPSKNKHKKAK